jgi:H+/gluconate symporter-like permease
MALFIVGVGVALLLLLMVGLKFDGFISLILVSLVVGFLEGMPLLKITASIYKGIGGQLNSLILVILMAISTFGDLLLTKKDPIMSYLHFFGDAPIALLISVLISIVTLGITRGKSYCNDHFSYCCRWRF